jgi:hypothetical protein
MKSIYLLAALAAPLMLTGCGTYVGYDDDYGPGGYYAGTPGYYDGVYGDVAVYGYDRGGYRAHYHHYDGGYHGRTSVASHNYSRGGTHVASSSHVSGHASGRGHASVSSGHSRF